MLGFTVAYVLVFEIRSRTTQAVLFLVCTVPFLTSNIIRMISRAPFLCRCVLLGVLGLFILFSQRPEPTILVLSFQGPDSGLTFPMNSFSLHWFARLLEAQTVGDFAGSLMRSFKLATMVMVMTLVVSLAAGMAFRLRFRGPGPLFTLTVASLIISSILVSLGVGLLFNALGLDPVGTVRHSGRS